MLVDMAVSSLTVDPFTSTPIVVLKCREGRQSLAIWIGLVEASAIATELDKIELDRPMTHDLMADLVKRMGAQVLRVEVTDLRDNTFFATLVVKGADGVEHGFDARPSDAIALALRLRAPIQVAQKVIDRARKIDLRVDPPAPNLRAETGRRSAVYDPPGSGNGHEEPLGNEPRSAEVLESLSAVAFGKWKM
jgi:bifunctional DNase/RNase